jgi:hypothetical protein
MARTNRHMVLVRALVPRINSRIPIWFPPGARNQNAELQVLRSSKGGNGNACADSGAKYNGVYENRICTPLEEGAVGLRLGATREILGGQPRYADSDAVLEIVE